MIDFSYTVTPLLRNEFEKIESLKKGIILTMLSPKEEIIFRWETLIERIVYSLRVEGREVRKTEIAELIKLQGKKSLDLEGEKIVEYKKAFDYIQMNWIVEPKLVESKDILKLQGAIISQKTKVESSDIAGALSFIQVNPEHPVVQAALAQMMILRLYGLTNESTRLSCLVATLFLFKTGYDMRRLVNIEEALFNDMSFFRDASGNSLTSNNVSPFLEYFIQTLTLHLERIQKRISEKAFDVPYHSTYFDLTERQKEILISLEEPGARITNKDVQKMFHVSQITASRELAKLTALGTIFPIGKGRSVYYTRV